MKRSIALMIVGFWVIGAGLGLSRGGEKSLATIRIGNDAQGRQIAASGVEIVVRQSHYVVVRLAADQEKELKDLGYSLSPCQEQDLVYRLIKISYRSKDEVHRLAQLGLDLWEVKENYAIARGLDKHLDKLQEENFRVEILVDNLKTYGPGTNR